MRRFVPLTLMLPLLVVAGCRLDTVIDAKGAGTMVVKYRLTSEAQLEANKKRFESASVQVTNAKLDAEKWATYELKFDDITKLNTTPSFKDTTITLKDADGGAKALVIKHVNKATNKLPEEMVAYFGKEMHLSVTLPGEIVATNATSKTDKTATWTYPLNDFTTAPELNLTVTFKPGEGAAPTQAAPKS